MSLSEFHPWAASFGEGGVRRGNLVARRPAWIPEPGPPVRPSSFEHKGLLVVVLCN